MKKIFKSILTFAMLSFALVGCEENANAPYEKGQPDVEGCYNVYFPAQDVDFKLDPAEDTRVVINVARTVTEGGIVVPMKITDESGIFKVSPIAFADGQSETTIYVDFNDAEVGVQYSCSIAIDDPQFRSTYSSMPFAIDVKVSREKWNDLGECTFTEDFLTSFFGVSLGTTWKVNVQESDTKKGLYRLINPLFGNPYVEEEECDGKIHYMTIHAENPNKVYIDQYFSGVDWGYGEFVFWSIAGYYLDKKDAEKAAEYYGTLNANKVITFPVSSLMIAMLKYDNGNLYTANDNGLFKIVLPGGKDVDYTLNIEATEAYNGVSDVYFETGADISKIKYACFEGDLNSAQAGRVMEAIKDGSEKSTEITPKDGEADVEVSFEKTGVYTVVAVGYDADTVVQNTAYASFNYLSATDTTALSKIDLTVGAAATGKYFKAGSSDNVIEYYVYGKDIKSAQVLIVTQDDLAADPAKVAENLAKQKPLSDSLVNLINTNGYVAYVKDLKPGTDYVVTVLASNGYTSDVFYATAKTTGRLQIEVKDMFGFYEATEVSGFDAKTYTSYYEIQESDSLAAGNVMFTIFDGFMCEYPVYANVDTDNNVLTISDEQYFGFNEEYQLHTMFAIATDKEGQSVEFEILGKGKFANPSLPFGVYLYDVNYTPKGFSDKYPVLSAKRVAASFDEWKEAQTSSVLNCVDASKINQIKSPARFFNETFARYNSVVVENAVAPVKAAEFTAKESNAKSKSVKNVSDFRVVDTNAKRIEF